MIARFQVGHALAHCIHHTGSFVAQNDWKRGNTQIPCYGIGVANPSCHNPDPDLAERRFGQLHRLQFECLTLFVGYCSFDFHGSLLVHSNAPTDWAGARSIQKMRRFRTGIVWVCVAH